MIKNILFLILTIAISASASVSYAENKIFFISPTRVELNDKQRVQVVNLTNLSDKVRAYKISIEDIIMTENGVTKPVDNFEFSAKRMIRFVPRDFVLKPNERQAIRIMGRIPENLADGEYHSHVMFVEDITRDAELNPVPKDTVDKGVKLSAEAAYQTLIPVIITRGSVNTQISMSDVTINRTDNGYSAALMLHRTGNGQGTAYIETAYSVNGNETMIDTRRTAYIYREINQRKYDFSFKLPKDAAAGGKVIIRLFDTSEKDASPINEVSLAP